MIAARLASAGLSCPATAAACLIRCVFVRLFRPSVLTEPTVLPDERQNLAAYLKLSRLLVGNYALVGGNDGDSQSAEHSGKLFLAGINTKAGLGNSLQSGDDLVILILTVLQGDVDGLERTVIQNVVLLNISLLQKNLCNRQLHFG